VESPRSRAKHLIAVRNLQRDTNGFTEFVPLPFVPMKAPIFLRGRARRGPTFREAILMHAVARLAVDPHIRNVQASWVKLGPEGAAHALRSGANDLGATLMDESISRAAGGAHGTEFSPEAMRELIRSADRTPRQRTTLHDAASTDTQRRADHAPPLAPLVSTPAREAGLTRPSVLVGLGLAVPTEGSTA